MLPDIAELLLVITLILSCVQVLLSAITKDIRPFKIIAVSGFISLSGSFLILILCFVISDFSVALVANNSHITKPIIYKISGAWGNHEGSMLMWLLILSLFNVIFAFFGQHSDQYSAYKRITLNVQGLIILMFATYTLMLSNPFVRIYPIPLTGLGLNPILQDIGLALHPPTLYLGYVGFSITYASAIAMLITRANIKIWAKGILPFIMLSWTGLTLGITLGSWWAYRELGWGGYWFWDPVENASLIPWLSATALLHVLTVIARSGYLGSWGIMLAILTFPLSGVGTFLVRSGTVTSVHSFATDPARGIAILAIVMALILFGMLVFLFMRNPHDPKIETFIKPLRRPFIIALNNIILVFFILVVMTGTLYPIALELLFSEKISVGAPYYNSLLAPTVAILLMLCIIAPKFSYTSISEKLLDTSSLASMISFLASIIISTCITWLLPEFQILAAIVIWLSSYLIIESLRALLSYKGANMALAHLGFGLVTFAITINSLSQFEAEKVIKLNETIKIGNYDIKLKAIDYYKGPNYLSRMAIFEAWHKNKFLGEIKPETHLYPVEDQQTAESGILHTILYDLYITIGDTTDNQDIVTRIYIRPMISFIWFGGLLLFISGLISTIRRFINSTAKSL